MLVTLHPSHLVSRLLFGKIQPFGLVAFHNYEFDTSEIGPVLVREIGKPGRLRGGIFKIQSVWVKQIHFQSVARRPDYEKVWVQGTLHL